MFYQNFFFFQTSEFQKSGYLFSKATLNDTIWKTKRLVSAASKQVYSFMRAWDIFKGRKYLYFVPQSLHMHLPGKNLSNNLYDLP